MTELPPWNDERAWRDLAEQYAEAEGIAFPVSLSGRRAPLSAPDADMYVRCADCGQLIDHILFAWYPMPDDSSLCHLCGPKRGLTGLIPAERAAITEGTVKPIRRR